MIPRRLPWLEPAFERLLPLAARGVHAVLLHGAAGVGKKSLAFDLAEALLCEAPRADGRGCGHCGECRLTAAFSHPDLRWVLPQALAEQVLPTASDEGEGESDAAGVDGADGEGRPARASREIRVEQIRALSDFLGIAAYRGGRRVVVLAPAEAMNAVAANTLLKMLEEPPPETMFVLVAHALDDLLPTIRSRCVLVQVPTPAAHECLPWLEAQGAADEAALALASGAPLAATAAAAQQALPADKAAELYRLLERGRTLTAAQVAAGLGRDPPVGGCLRVMQCWAFDLLSYRARASVRYHPRHLATIGKLARSVRIDALWGWADALKNASAVRDHPLNPRLVVESLLSGYIGIFDEGR